MRGPARLAGGAMLLIGLLASAGEFRHGTVLTTRLAEPRSAGSSWSRTARWRCVGLAVGVLLAHRLRRRGRPAAPRPTTSSIQPFAHGVPTVALLVPALMALHAALGVAVGSLLRNTAAAVGVTLVWAFVVEGILPQVLIQPDDGQLAAGRSGVAHAGSGQTEPGQLTPAAAAALLAGYAVALSACSIVLDRRREV